MRRALVVGCGYVGTVLGAMLARSDWRVWGIRRDAADLPSGITPLSADVVRPESLDEALEAAEIHGPDVVAYAVSADERTSEAYRAAYVDGLQNVLEALERRGARPRRLLYVSSTAVYGGRDGAWVDEDTPIEPEGFRQQLLIEGERVARASAPRSVTLRLAGIYGPGRTSLIERVRRGDAVCPPGDPVYTNRIHRDDAAGMLAHLATLDEPADSYLGVDREPADLCTVYRWLAEQLGVPEPGVGDAETEPRRRRSNKRCRGARIVSSGYVVQYPTFREGYGSLLREKPSSRLDEPMAEGRT